MNADKYLEEMLASGKGINQILSEIKENLLEIQEAQEKQKIAAARIALVKAIDEYGYALNGTHLGAEGAKQVEDELIKFEKCSNSVLDFWDWLNLA